MLIINSVLLCVFLTFNEFGLDCNIYGYVNRNHGGLKFVREDLCDRIKYSYFNEGIMLYSNNYWVFISGDLLTNKLELFYYRWGSNRAYIRGVPVSVEFGYVVGG